MKTTLIIFTVLLCSCSNYKALTERNEVVLQNNAENVRIIKSDSLFINWINEFSNEKNILPWCLEILVDSSTREVKHIYSEHIYFIGKLSKDNMKIGEWRGFYKNKLVVITAYIENSTKNISQPAYLKIWDNKKEIMVHKTFSIIN